MINGLDYYFVIELNQCPIIYEMVQCKYYQRAVGGIALLDYPYSDDEFESPFYQIKFDDEPLLSGKRTFR